ncbi:hypothetical protein HDR66_00705 [bacterium]|nr:hypothetical protein [bacterium]
MKRHLLKKFATWFFSVIICGVLVGLLGNRIYYRYFEMPNLAYTAETFILAHNEMNLRGKMKISINDKNVRSLYITTVTLINNGGATLNRGDLREETNPVRIMGRNIEAVFVDKINTTTNARVKLVRRRGGMRVNFKWMNPGEQIVLKVIHRRRGDNIRVVGAFNDISHIDDISREKLPTCTINPSRGFIIMTAVLSSIFGAIFATLIMLWLFKRPTNLI